MQTTSGVEAAIREMEDRDRDRVIDLIWQLNLFEEAISRDRALDRKAAAAGLARNRRRMSEHGGIELVAEVEGQVVGYLLCVIEMAQPYVRQDLSRQAYVAELVIDERQRGRGLGSRLIDAAESFARAQDAASIFIGVLAGNDPADRLYEHLGFRAYAIERVKRLD